MFHAEPDSMLTSSLAVAPLAASGAAWLIAAAALALDLRGRLPRRGRRENRSRRRLLAVLLSTVTGAALAQVGALGRWSLPLRETFDAAVVVLAIALVTCVLTAVPARRKPGPDPAHSWPEA